MTRPTEAEHYQEEELSGHGAVKWLGIGWLALLLFVATVAGFVLIGGE